MESELDKPTSFFRFEDLRIYHKAMDYVGWVLKKTSAIRSLDHGLLSDRFAHAAQDIVINIAEGSARNKSQFVYYLKMSKSALRDCLVYTTLAAQLGYFNSQEETYSREYLMEMTKMLGALIGSIQKATGSNVDDFD